MKLQISITEIDNGFLVATQPQPNEQVQMQARGEVVQPKVIYCDDIKSVCMTIEHIADTN